MGRSEALSALEDRELAGFDIFTQEELETLADYNITTCGQLLGATAGLGRRDSLRSMGIRDEAVETFAEQVPELVLARYGAPVETPPMGLTITEDDHDDDAG